jgi:hypothetical protein
MPQADTPTPTAAIAERVARLAAVASAVRSALHDERSVLIAGSLKAEIDAALGLTLAEMELAPGLTGLGSSTRLAALDSTIAIVTELSDEVHQGLDPIRAAHQIEDVIREARHEGVLPTPIVITDPHGRRVELTPAAVAVLECVVGEDLEIVDEPERSTGRIVATVGRLALQELGRGRVTAHALDLDLGPLDGSPVTFTDGRMLGIGLEDGRDMGFSFTHGSAPAESEALTA